MARRLWAFALVGLLYGCSDTGYLPYAPHALNPMQIDDLVASASQASGVAPGLIRAVLMSESAGNPSAISSAGAQGLMQLMPGTSAGCGGNALQALAHDEGIILGSKHQHGTTLTGWKAAQAGGTGGDGDGKIEREEGFTTFGFAADDSDRLGAPQAFDQPARR